MEILPQIPHNHYLEGGGEMGELTRSYNWSATSLGAVEQWSHTLLSTLNIVLQSKFPMFLLWGDDLIQFYNDAYRPSLGNHGKHPTALGQKGEECWTEIWSTIKPLIEYVQTTGESTWSEDQLIPIYRNNQLEDVYWTFSHSRIKGVDGRTEGVLVICHETTEKVMSYNSLKESAMSLANMQLEQQEQYNRLFMQAPAGICILSGPQLVFELANPFYQRLLPDRELLGKPIFEALPELEFQPIGDILRNTYKLGEPFEAQELLIPIKQIDSDELVNRYFNFIYQPRHDAFGKVDGILVFVYDVTTAVNSRLELEKIEDALALAIKAAELGTFDMDLIKGTMHWDKRCRILFGISHNNDVSYEKDFIEGLHPDDRDRIINIVNKVFVKSISNGEYDVEYRTIGAEDKKVRWVRAKGKAYFNEDDQPIRFTGAVLDITEQKSDELLKNDFIGIVSHELKTPLTSLTVYIQMMNAKARKLDDTFAAETLAKSNIQVRKMRNIINSFLNLSRFEAGKFQLDIQDFDLKELLNEIIEEHKLVLPSYDILFTPCETVIVTADRDKIAAVISNLLSNAAKYSLQSKEISLKCSTIGGAVQVTVTDNGMGIREQDIEKVFERYFRVETNNHNISGFGIGLYLSAEVIKKHNGDIGVKSELGKGSSFYFTLPLKNHAH